MIDWESFLMGSREDGGASVRRDRQERPAPEESGSRVTSLIALKSIQMATEAGDASALVGEPLQSRRKRPAPSLQDPSTRAYNPPKPTPMRSRDRHKKRSSLVTCSAHRTRHSRFSPCPMYHGPMCRKCTREPAGQEGLCYPCRYYGHA